MTPEAGLHRRGSRRVGAAPGRGHVLGGAQSAAVAVAINGRTLAIGCLPGRQGGETACRAVILGTEADPRDAG